MNQVSFGQFGMGGFMSGLYIEMVWGLSDEDWTSYIDWAKDLITKKS